MTDHGRAASPSSSNVRIGLADAVAILSPDRPFATLIELDQDITVDLYKPVGEDCQQPHDRDEIYIIASGIGAFRCGDEVVRFSPGDLLHVPAHVPHRFEGFSANFATWVIFYGPVRPRG